MSSKRDKFYALCRKLWTAGTVVFAASAIFIAGSNYAPNANAQWGGETHIFPTETITVNSGDQEEATSLLVDGTLNVSGTVTTTENVTIGKANTGTKTLHVNGGLLEVGAAEYPENTPGLGGGSTLRVSSGGALVLDDGTSFDNAARVLLDGNVSITGTGSTVSLGSYGLINGTKQEAATGMGYYRLGSGDAGDGSITISSAAIEMGESSAILGGNGGISISNSSIFGAQSITDGVYVAGNQTIESAGIMDITGSNFTFGDEIHLRSGGKLNFTNSTLNAGAYHILGSDDVTITGSTFTLTGDGGSIASEKNVTITNNSTVKQGSYGNISGVEVAINGSTVTQENHGVIGGGVSTHLTLDNANVSQENDGRITVVGTPSGTGTLDITNGSKVEQGNNGTISIGGGALAGGSINITGAGTTVDQGVGGKITAGKTSNGGGNITINSSAKVDQGADSEIRAAGNLAVGAANINQGENSEIQADGNMTLTGANIAQGANGEVYADGTLAVANTNITQGVNSSVQSNQAFTLNGSTITQGDKGNVASLSTLDLTNAAHIIQGDQSNVSSVGSMILDGSSTIVQDNNSEVYTGGNLAISGAITQGDIGKVNAEGDLTLNSGSIIQEDDSEISAANITAVSGTTMTQDDNSSIRGNSLVLNGTVVQGDESHINGVTSVDIGGNITQEDSSTISTNGTLTLAASGRMTQGDDARITGDSLVLGGTIVQEKSSKIEGTTSVNITGSITQENGLSTNRSEIIGGTMNISGGSNITQGNYATIRGNYGVNMTGGTITQGNNAEIAAGLGENITLGGTIKQGNEGTIVTTGGGTLAFNSGATVTQDYGGRLINDNTGVMNLSNVRISQGSTSQFTTGGALNIDQSTSLTQGTSSRLRASGDIRVDNATIVQGADSSITTTGSMYVNNKASVSQRAGSSINLGSNGKLVVDNASLETGADGTISTGHLGDASMTDAQKRLADTSIEVINGGELTLGMGTRLLSSNAASGSSAFHKIVIGANSVIDSYGLLTFNNDWIDVQDGGRLQSTVPNGMIQLTNNSRLYGTGQVASQGGLHIADGSVLAAGGNFGDDIGVLTVVGPLMITSDGTLEITVNGNDYDLIDVKDYRSPDGSTILTAGDVLLAGNLIMDGLTQEDLDNNNVYTIIQSEGTISGQLNSGDWWAGIADQWIENNPGGLSTYNISLTRQEQFFGLRGKTYNQKAGGRMLDQVTLAGDWSTHFNAINAQLNAGNYEVLDMVGGVVKANGMYLYRETPWRTAMNQYGWNMCGQAYLGYQNKYCPNICSGREIWATPYHTESKYKTDSNAKKYDASTTGFMAGINYRVSPQTVFGIVVGYGRPELDQGRDEIEADDFLIGLQAGTMLTSKVELKAMLAGGFQQYSMKRFLNGNWLGTNANAWAKSDYDGNTLMASVELARPIYFNNRTMLRPVIAFEAENVWQEAFKENGGGDFNLQYDKATYNQAYFRVGTSGDADMGAFSLTGHAFYSYQLLGDTYSEADAILATSNKAGAGYQTVRGIDLDRHFLNVGGGAYMYLNPMKTSTLAVNYDATISDKATSHAVLLGFSQLF